MQGRSKGWIVKVCLFIGCLLIGFMPTGVEGQGLSKGSPVVVDGRELFTIHAGMGSLTARERAEIIARRIEEVAEDLRYDPEDMDIRTVEAGFGIAIGEKAIMTVTSADARVEGRSLELAQERVETIQDFVTAYRKERVGYPLHLSISYSLLLVIAWGISLQVFRKMARYAHDRITAWKEQEKGLTLQVQRFEILSKEQLYQLLRRLIHLLTWSVQLTMAYFFLYFLLFIFPETRKYAHRLLETLASPLMALLESALGYLPNFAVIVVIFLVSRYILKGVRLFFYQVEEGVIHISGFHREWVDTTYKIVRFIVMMLALISMFPYIPGSDSSAFRGISVFLGLLFSLGSTSAVANVIGSVSLTYMRAFQIGDRVKIGEHTGDIIEKSFLVTRIRTIKNVDVIIPNSAVLSSAIINYSSAAEKEGLILHMTVTLSYSVPWPKVHQLLVQAALATPDILPEPKPFVLQTALHDYTVAYEINGYTKKPNDMAQIYSDLQQNVLDTFHKAKVEMLSPSYMAIRNGKEPAIPPE